jgi:hypothetical protein
MKRGLPNALGKKGVLNAKRDLLIEAVRAWAEVTGTDVARRGFKPLACEEATEELLEAWREYSSVEGRP